MKKLIAFSILLLFVFAAKAQTDSDTTKKQLFEIADKQPIYPGGEEARQKFLAENMIYPDSAIKYGKQGMIIVQFVVEEDGSLSGVKAVKSFDDYCAAEAVRVVSMMKWVPGESRNKPIRVMVSMPIKFRLK